MAAPPVQKEWSYQELKDQAKANNIATIQTAVSHDCLIATTHQGWRFASLVADKDVPTLLLEVTQPDGSLPFEVLPIDKNRAAVREFAKHWLNIMGALWLADQADLLPWDTTPYGSLAEREAAQRDGVTKRKKLLPQLYDAIVAKKKKNKGRKAPVRVEQDVALRRVLGLSSWDAAKELKQKTLMRLEKVKDVHVELLEHEVAKVPGAFQRLKEVPWVTPLAVGYERLPSLEQLRQRACCVATEAGVAYWIRAHPEPPRWARPEAGGEALTRLAASVDKAQDYFDSELGLCRLDPDFSAFYGQRIYACKRLVAA